MSAADKLRSISAGLDTWRAKLDAEPVIAQVPSPKKSLPKPLFDEIVAEVVPETDPFAGLLAAPKPKREPKPVSPEDVIKVLPEGFSAVSDASGVVHDGVTIAILCPKKHMHKYKMRSLVTSKTIKCITCAAGPAFPRTCREIAEEIFGAPFVFTPCDTPAVSEYRCPIYKITLICEHGAGFDSFTHDDITRVIRIGKCSEAKIKPAFWRLLSATDIRAGLTQGQQKRVDAIAPAVKSRRPSHVKTPLPVIKSSDATDFCIENCGL